MLDAFSVRAARIEPPTVLEAEIPPKRLGALQDVIDFLNKGVWKDEFPIDSSEAEIVKILGLPDEEYLDAPYFSVTRGYLAPFTLHVVSEE